MILADLLDRTCPWPLEGNWMMDLMEDGIRYLFDIELSRGTVF